MDRAFRLVDLERHRALAEELRRARHRAAEESIAQRGALERMTASVTSVVHEVERLADLVAAIDRDDRADRDALRPVVDAVSRRLAGVQAALAALLAPAPARSAVTTTNAARTADLTAGPGVDATAEAVVRERVLDTLVRDVGDRAVVVEVVAAFVGVLDQRLAGLADAVHLGPVTARDAVASMRTSCELLGLDHLAVQAERFAEGEIDLGALMSAATRTRRGLRRWTGEVAPVAPLVSARSAFG